MKKTQCRNAECKRYGCRYGKAREIRSSDNLDGVQHVLRMSRYLDAAPLFCDRAICIDEKSAALNATYLLAIHVFQLHDTEQIAYAFIGIGKQFEGETHICLEFLVCRDTVPGNTKDMIAKRAELWVQVAKLHAFAGASGRVVARIEINNKRMAAKDGEPEALVTGGGQFEIGKRLACHECAGYEE